MNEIEKWTLTSLVLAIFPLLLLSFLGSAICPSGNIPDEGEVIIEFVSYKGHAFTEFKKNATVNYTGEVTGFFPSDPSVQYYEVQLEVDACPYNSSKIAPLLFYKVHKMRPFYFEVYVPWNADPAGIIFITIGGIWRKVPSNETFSIVPVSVLLIVEKYYLLEIEHGRSIDIEHGKSGRLDMVCINNGNSAWSPRMVVRNSTQLERKGIHIETSIPGIKIPQYQRQNCSIRIVTNRGIPSGDHKIELIFYSKSTEIHDDKQVSFTSNLTVHVKGSLVTDLGLEQYHVWIASFFIPGMIVILVVLVVSIFRGAKNRKERLKSR